MRNAEGESRAAAPEGWWRKLPERLASIAAIGRIRTRLLLGFGLMGIVVALVAIVGLVSNAALARTTDDALGRSFPATVALDEARSSMLMFGNYADLTVMNASEGNAGRIPNHVKRMDAAAAQVEAALVALRDGDAERGTEKLEDAASLALLERMVAEWGELKAATYGKVKRDLDAGGYVVNIESGLTQGGGTKVQGVTDLQNVEIKREKVTQSADEMQVLLAAGVASSVKEVNSTQQLATGLSVLAIAFGLLLALLIALGVSGSITVPLGVAVQYAESVAAGDMAAQLESHTGDEIGDLTRAVAVMKDGLVSRMLQLKDVADSVTQAAANFAKDADGIAQATSKLAQGAEIQSSTAEETSASIEELAVSIDQVAVNAESLGTAASETAATMGQMSVSIEQIAHNMTSLSDAVADTSSSVEEMLTSIEQVASLSGEVFASSQRALEAASSGGDAVDTMADTVQEITGATEDAATVMQGLASRISEIGEITETIDDIAEQTNLLALNAAIEAARAGEHGRGFAVVAEAVRDLAGRATASTREISKLIATITTDTESAVAASMNVLERASGSMKLAQEAQEALGKVNTTFDEVAESMQQVTTATAEQVQGGRKVISVVEQMNSLHREVDESMREQAIASKRVVDASEDMSARVNEVATAMGEQKRGGEQMVSAMESIAQTTRSNMASVAELAESAARLADQSEGLRVLVTGFALDEQGDAEAEEGTEA